MRPLTLSILCPHQLRFIFLSFSFSSSFFLFLSLLDYNFMVDNIRIRGDGAAMEFKYIIHLSFHVALTRPWEFILFSYLKVIYSLFDIETCHVHVSNPKLKINKLFFGKFNLIFIWYFSKLLTKTKSNMTYNVVTKQKTTTIYLEIYIFFLMHHCDV